MSTHDLEAELAYRNQTRLAADMAMDHWYKAGHVGLYDILEGAGTDGGDWVARGRGETVKFKSRKEAEEHAHHSSGGVDSKPAQDADRYGPPEPDDLVTVNYGQYQGKSGKVIAGSPSATVSIVQVSGGPRINVHNSDLKIKRRPSMDQAQDSLETLLAADAHTGSWDVEYTENGRPKTRSFNSRGEAERFFVTCESDPGCHSIILFDPNEKEIRTAH
jgi:hypothetical protein